MRATPVDLIGGFYKDDSLPWSCQDTVNWLPVLAEVAGTRTTSKFSTAPGLKPWQQIGTGPIRGMHDCEGLRLVVSGRYLFRISNDGIGVPIGVIPGVGRVQMTHNQFSTGFQVLVEDGQGGGGYVYTTTDGSFAKIVDEAYPGSISSDYLDSFLLGVEPQGRYWFHSNLADAKDYNSLDRYEAEAAPDRIVGLAVSQSEVVIFGQRTIEFFFNAGVANNTFQNRRQSITRGCASRHTIQKLDNTLFWLGDDGVVYRLDGYALRPVSTWALEKAIADSNFAEAIAYVWEDRGHKVYYLTIPNGQTFGYDVITGVWHRRQSFGLNRWRLSHIQKWGGNWYGGDFQNGRIWQIAWDYFLEGDQPIISERTSGVVADNQSAMVIPNAELIFDTGQGPETTPIPFPIQPSTPTPTGNAPDAGVGAPYVPYQYGVTGGTAPYTFAVVSGSIPPGMTLSASGLLSGSATTLGSYTYTIRVTDSKSLWGELTDTVSVALMAVALGTTTTGQRTVSSADGLVWGNQSSTTFSGAGVVSGVASGRFLVVVGSSFYYSDSYGSAWTQISGGGNEAYSGVDTYGGVVLACRGNNAGVGRYGRSLDNGLTFTWQNTSLGFNVHIPLFSRATPTRVIMVGTSAGSWALSTDGGVTFPTAVSTPSSITTRSAVYGNGAFYIAGDNTNPYVFKTTDGATVEKTKAVDLLSTSSVVKIAYGLVGGTPTLVVVLQDGSIYASKDDLTTFVKSTFTVPGVFRNIVHNGSRFVVASTTGLYQAIDPVSNFAVVSSALTSPSYIGVSPT